MNALPSRILRRSRAHAAHGARKAFTAKDFLDFGNRDAVDQALSRLHKDGRLRRVARGVYDVPRDNPILNRPAAPDIGAFVDAIARRDNLKVAPDGLVAANRLGLTNAVPARNRYLTDGPSRTYRVGRSEVKLTHANPKSMILKDGPIGDVVRALHWLGASADDGDIADTLRRKLPDAAKAILSKGRNSVSGRAAKVIDQVLAPA